MVLCEFWQVVKVFLVPFKELVHFISYQIDGHRVVHNNFGVTVCPATSVF